MVASVGPYKFSTIDRGAALCHCAARAAGSASPQNRLTRSDGSESAFSPPVRDIIDPSDGTENHDVTPCFRKMLAGDMSSAPASRTRRPPVVQAHIMS